MLAAMVASSNIDDDADDEEEDEDEDEEAEAGRRVCTEANGMWNEIPA